MSAVDMLFEVKNQTVPMYQEPGVGEPNGNVLPPGSKGQATFKVVLGKDQWFQVKSKKGSGWVNGSLLALYDLSPQGLEEGETPPKPPVDTISGKREEATYFQANIDEAVAYKAPSDKSEHVGTLKEGVAYKATQSEKVEGDRWFLIEIQPGLKGWVQGIDLQLADVPQAVQQAAMDESSGFKEKKSAFAAEWIEATVKGVGVYSRPSIVGKRIRLINPTEIFKVLELSEGGGKEWYKIQLSKKGEGWVQSMDVKLTQALDKKTKTGASTQ